MTPLFKKLNFKQQNEICILQHPPEFQKELDAMKEFTKVRTDLGESNSNNSGFVLAFVKSREEIDRLALAIDNYLNGDSIIWFAWPKKSSKKYSVEISRDAGWNIMKKLKLEGVRSVAIDNDWSALRFRKSRFIKR